MSSLLLYKKYGGESVADIYRDVDSCFDRIRDVTKVPTDKHGFHRGEFKVTIEWIGDDDCWCTGFDHYQDCKNHWTNHPEGQPPF
jgi:hypothetical protein